MEVALSRLVSRLEEVALAGTNVIPWSCPVPSFGDLSHARIATLGLNPSNREFVDDLGNELEGPLRRFHTLRSLGLERWSEATARHMRLITDACRLYFSKNPYDRWFKRLDNIISGTTASYYSGFHRACHLDLIPYATACKWTELTPRQRTALLSAAGDSLAQLLRDSPVRLLVLNGNSVVEYFQSIAGVRLERKEMQEWRLPRQGKAGVAGFAYRGAVRELSGIRLENELLVIGFNHNIQSSFGVTTEVLSAIRRWISRTSAKVLL